MLETIDGGQLARLIICRTGAEKGEGPVEPEGPLGPFEPLNKAPAPAGPMAWWLHSWWLHWAQSSFIPTVTAPEVFKERCHCHVWKALSPGCEEQGQ